MPRLFLIASFAVLLTAVTAHAAAVCGARGALKAGLTGQHSEVVAGRGKAGQGKLMVELYTSGSGTWTVLATTPEGQSCILAAGQNWAPIKQVFGDPS